MSDQGRVVAGRYRLVERIGRGGMGTVWRAEDELLGRQVAVKKLHPPQPHLHEDELATLFERTRREARSAARISHPNVIVVHDVVDDDGSPSIVMEYVPSVTLGELLKKKGKLSPQEAARIGRGMVAALRAAHRAGVLHRDVKPGNVLLGEDGRVVLTDFGIAMASGTSTLTRTGELIGSIDFLSPERIKGVTPGPEADLWALGATLYQAVEGRSPFHRDTPIETAYAIAEEPVVPAANAGPLERVIAGLLAKEPSERMSAEEAERLLRMPAAEAETAATQRRRFGVPAAPEPVPTGVTAAMTPAQPSRRPRRKAPWIVAVVAVGALGAAGAMMAGRLSGGSPAAAADPSGSHPAATATTPAPSESSDAPPVPDGYRLDTEQAKGYSVPVPEDWTRRAKDGGQQIDFVDPTGLVAVTISSTDYAATDQLAHMAQVESQTRSQVDGYRRLRMQQTTQFGQPAAIWEFSFKGRVRGFRAIDLCFGKPGGREYAVYLSAPEDRWNTYRPMFDNAVKGFRMAGQ